MAKNINHFQPSYAVIYVKAKAVRFILFMICCKQDFPNNLYKFYVCLSVYLSALMFFSHKGSNLKICFERYKKLFSINSMSYFMAFVRLNNL